MPGYVVVALSLIALGLIIVVGVVVTRTRGPKASPRIPTSPADLSRVADADHDADRQLETAAPAHVVSPDDVLAGLEPTLAPEFERPEPAAGRLQRLRDRLSRSQSTLGRGLLTLMSRDRIDDDAWQDIEDTLIAADVGVAASTELVERLKTRVRVEAAAGDRARLMLREELVALVGADLDRSLHVERQGDRPAVVLVVGVNGVGKTTTVGKLARVLVADDKDVLLGAADTFRAAAADQLTTWGERVGVTTVRGAEGSDPASVAFEAARAGVEQEVDTVIVDTAGRLHTKVGLMDELGKVKRVVERHGVVTEVLLVIDATTGQNGLVQARIFAEAVDVTGIVLTKLDGTAKGGIVVAVQRDLGVPVKLIGLGEGADDLAPFDAEDFVDALLG